ncbi:MAG: hypothetical protein EOP92_21205, partial [Lysobacteraceae bacterium]
MASSRSTRASAAVERLKRRTGNSAYSMARTGDGLFYLSEAPGAPFQALDRRTGAGGTGAGHQ